MITGISSPFTSTAPTQVLCVILEASFAPELETRLQQSSTLGSERWVSLFDDTPYAHLRSVGPYALLCTRPDGLKDYARELLERADAGCVALLADEQAFDTLVAHWRSVMTVSTDDIPARVFRFYEPRWLEPLLNSLDEKLRVQFMGPVTGLAWRNELGWRHLANPQPVLDMEVQKPGWLHLSRERLALLGERRLTVLAERFALDYQAVLSMPKPVEFVYRQLLSARQAGYSRVDQQEHWLRLALQKGEAFWRKPPYSELLSRDDLSLDDKLMELERLSNKDDTP